MTSAQERAKAKGRGVRDWAESSPVNLDTARDAYGLPDEMPDSLVSRYAEAKITLATRESEDADARTLVDDYNERFGGLKDVSDLHIDAARDSLEWVDLPIDVFPSAADAYIMAQARAIGCHPATIALPVLGQLAAAVANSHRIELKGNWQEPSALWVIQIGKSGTHKTPAIHKAVRPMMKREKGAADDYEQAVELYEAELTKYQAKKPSERKPDEKPARPVAVRYRTSDATMEGLAVILSDVPRGIACVRDEVAGLLGSFDKYNKGSADAQSWIETWGGYSVVIDRKTGDRKTIRIDRPNVTIIGGTQPAVLRERLNDGLFDSGFAARLILCEPPALPRRFTEDDIELSVWEAYEVLVDGLYSRTDDGDAIPLSPKALKLWRRYYDASAAATEKLKSDRLRSAFVKGDSNCARIALVFHLADVPPGQNPPPISFDAMRRAVVYSCWQRHETARIYDRYGFSKKGERGRYEKLCGDLPERFTWKDVADVWGVEKSQAFSIIDRLKEAKLIEDDGHGFYRNRTVDFMDYPDLDGIRLAVEPLLAGLGADSPESPVSPPSNGPEREIDPEPPDARKNGSHNEPAGDGTSTDERALVWDEDDGGGDPE